MLINGEILMEPGRLRTLAAISGFELRVLCEGPMERLRLNCSYCAASSAACPAAEQLRPASVWPFTGL